MPRKERPSALSDSIFSAKLQQQAERSDEPILDGASVTEIPVHNTFIQFASEPEGDAFGKKTMSTAPAWVGPSMESVMRSATHSAVQDVELDMPYVPNGTGTTQDPIGSSPKKSLVRTGSPKKVPVMRYSLSASSARAAGLPGTGAVVTSYADEQVEDSGDEEEVDDEEPDVDVQGLVTSTIMQADEEARAAAELGDLPSLGSAKHAEGLCKRCCFFPKGRCVNGTKCEFCHYDHEKRKRKKKKKGSKKDSSDSDEDGDGHRQRQVQLLHPGMPPTAPPPPMPAIDHLWRWHQLEGSVERGAGAAPCGRPRSGSCVRSPGGAAMSNCPSRSRSAWGALATPTAAPAPIGAERRQEDGGTASSHQLNAAAAEFHPAGTDAHHPAPYIDQVYYGCGASYDVSQLHVQSAELSQLHAQAAAGYPPYSQYSGTFTPNAAPYRPPPYPAGVQAPGYGVPPNASLPSASAQQAASVATGVLNGVALPPPR